MRREIDELSRTRLATMGTADAFNDRIHELEMTIRKIEGTEKEVYAVAWDSLKATGQG